MAAHGHTATFGTYLGNGQATQGWYAQAKAWLAARRDVKRAGLNTYWDAKREAVRPFRADAAIDMVAPAHAYTTAAAFSDLGL